MILSLEEKEQVREAFTEIGFAILILFLIILLFKIGVN
tara:strand:+ start:10978 stop:11091 length:114 start_codon:yes stop_codon:yes gene_type:complete